MALNQFRSDRRNISGAKKYIRAEQHRGQSLIVSPIKGIKAEEYKSKDNKAPVTDMEI